MSLELIRAPTIDVVTLDEVKAHVRIETENHDVYLASLILAAQGVVETLARQSLVTTTWRQGFDCFPRCGAIELYWPPLQSITSVKYINDAGVETTWNSANYAVDTASKPGRIIRGYGVQWPQVRREGAVAPITVEYIAGYPDAASVPAQFKAAIKILVAWWFDQSAAANVGHIVSKLPFNLDMLVASGAHGSYP